MLWPDHPEDAKSLLISLLAGLVVSLVVVLKDIYILLWPNQAVLFSTLLLAVLILLALFFLWKYAKLRDGLIKIEALSNRRKK